MLRAIKEIQPRWVVGENVRGLINWSNGMVFDEVQADLEAEGYEVFPFLLPAAGINAPHERYRIWFVAYAEHNGTREAGRSDTDEAGRTSALQTPQQGRHGKTVLDSGLCDIPQSIADATNSGPKDMQRERPNAVYEPIPFANTDGLRRLQGIGGNETTIHNAISTERTTTNTDGKGLEKFQRIGRNNESKRPAFERDFNRWKIWPTQPPICGGNDGLPNRLDGITLPRWRRESIRAFGNAIVPGVALQIFKSIAEYELLTCR